MKVVYFEPMPVTPTDTPQGLARPALRRLALATGVLCIACSTQEGASQNDGVWYRAAFQWDSYFIARADPEADSCVLLTIGAAGEGPVPDEPSGVTVVGGEAALSGAQRGAIASRCGTDGLYVNTPVDRVSGTIHLRDFVMTPEGEERACTIDVDVVADEVLVRQFGMPVWSEFCPRPSGVLETLDELDAAYSHEDQRLTIAGWNSETEVCVWFEFGPSTMEYLGTGLELPLNWIPIWGHISPMDQATCDATTLGQYMGGVGDSVNVLDYEGMLAFRATTPGQGEGFEFEVPCELDLELLMSTGESYYWVPNQVLLQASAIDVSGACE